MTITSTIKNHRWGAGTFLFVALLGYGARQAIGTVYSSAEATQLIEALSRAGLYLGSAIVTASVTTLALMLTMIGMLRRMEEDFDDETYRNVDLVARLAASTLMIALLVLLAFTLPVGEFETLPGDWYPLMYNAMYAASVIMVGLQASTVVVLYRTLRRVIRSLTPGEEV